MSETAAGGDSASVISRIDASCVRQASAAWPRTVGCASDRLVCAEQDEARRKRDRLAERGVRTAGMRSAAARAISHDAMAVLLATTKFQSDCDACRSTSHTTIAAMASHPIAAGCDRVAQRGTRPLSASSRPDGASVARGPNDRRERHAKRGSHDRPLCACQRERSEHDVQQEEHQRDRDDASREPCFDTSTR